MTEKKTPAARAGNEKNIIVTKNGKARRARPSELTWFKQRGWKEAALSTK